MINVVFVHIQFGFLRINKISIFHPRSTSTSSSFTLPLCLFDNMHACVMFEAQQNHCKIMKIELFTNPCTAYGFIEVAAVYANILDAFFPFRSTHYYLVYVVFIIEIIVVVVVGVAYSIFIFIWLLCFANFQHFIWFISRICSPPQPIAVDLLFKYILYILVNNHSLCSLFKHYKKYFNFIIFIVVFWLIRLSHKKCFFCNYYFSMDACECVCVCKNAKKIDFHI